MEQRRYLEWEAPITPEEAIASTPTVSAVRRWGKAIGVLRSTGLHGGAQLWRFGKGEWTPITRPADRVASGLNGYGAPAWTPFGAKRALCLIPSLGVVQLLDREGNLIRAFPLEGLQQGFLTRWSKHEFAYVADFGPKVGRAIVVVDIERGLSRDVWRTPDLIGGLSVEVRSGHVAWHSWRSGTMPWDSAQVFLADRAYMYLRPEIVAGTDGHAACNPTWIDGDLYFQHEADELFKPVRLRDGEATTASAVVGESLSDWFFGWPWTVGCSLGSAHVSVKRSTTFLNLWRGDGSIELIESVPVSIQEVAGRGDRLFFTGGDVDQSSALWEYNVVRHRWKQILPTSETQDSGAVVGSELRRTDSGVPFVYYEPHRDDFVAPVEDRPGLILDIHGGPTAYAKRGLRATTQYFVQSGFAFASVDYRGSVGYGATYRRSLNGHYGEFDVADIQAVARYLIETGEVDPQRIFVRGGSSGGMTAILAGEDHTFSGVIAHYPVTDAHRLNDATVEIEQRYLEELIGPLPEHASKFDEISPFFRRQFPKRILITQGTNDVVIPVELVRDYVAKLEAAGVAVTYLELEGEGHGYRTPTAQAHVLTAEIEFLRG